MSTPERPKPDIDGKSAAFWEGVKAGRLLLQRCGDCRKIRYPVNDTCPKCLSGDFEWDEVTGRGEVFSSIVFHQVYNEAFRGEVPYNVSVIQLDEGPRMMSNVVGVPPQDVAVGDRVHVVFNEISDFFLPRFMHDQESRVADE